MASAAPIRPTDAFAAVAPGGAIDIDLVRRSHASAQYAAKAVMGVEWPLLVAQGWQVIAVRVVPAGYPEVQETPAPPPPRPRRPSPGITAQVERIKALLHC